MGNAASDYTGNIAGIYRDLARGQAEARLRKGEAQAGGIIGFGQALAGIPEGLQRQKQFDQQSQILEENLRRLQEDRAEDQLLSQAIKASVVDGQVDSALLTQELTKVGAAQITPRVLQTIQQASIHAQQLKNLEVSGRASEQELHSAALQYLGTFIPVLEEAQFAPGAVNAALAVVAIDKGQQEADALKAKITADPSLLPTMAKQWRSMQQSDKPVVVAENAALVGPGGQELYKNQGAEKPQTIDQMMAAALKAGNREEVNRLIKFKAQEAAATRAPSQGAQPNYQRIETVDASGNPLVQFMTPEEVRAQGGIKTPPKTTAKATGPAAVDAVLGEIEDLSKKINTVSSGPGANVQGALRNIKSSLNMDNEVSEYKRLVTGFIPIMARSVGHTGVLTQMDVDSTQALFPKVGDNATLSTNLIGRVKRIMSALQDPSVAALGPDAPFATKLNAAMAIAGKGGAKTPDPLGIRK